MCFSFLKLQEQKPFSNLETPFLDLLALGPCLLYVLNLKFPASSGEIAGAEYAVGGRGERNLQRGGNKVPIYRNTSSCQLDSPRPGFLPIGIRGGCRPAQLRQVVRAPEPNPTHGSSVRTFRFPQHYQPWGSGGRFPSLPGAPPGPAIKLHPPADSPDRFGHLSLEPRAPLGAQRSVLGPGCQAGWPRAPPLPLAGRRQGSGSAPCREEGGLAAPAELPPPLWLMAPKNPPGSSPRSSGLGSFCSQHAHSFLNLFFIFRRGWRGVVGASGFTSPA